ncbi:transposase [Streptomyces sp. SKN60]|nr:transposase [Streptomyces sp. SKN60]
MAGGWWLVAGGWWRDHRQVLEGIVFKFRTGLPWRDLPERFGTWQTVHGRFTRPLDLRPSPAPGNRPQPHPAAAVRQADASSEDRPPAHWTGRHPRHGVHHRPPRRGRRPKGSRPLGG